MAFLTAQTDGRQVPTRIQNRDFPPENAALELGPGPAGRPAQPQARTLQLADGPRNPTRESMLQRLPPGDAEAEPRVGFVRSSAVALPHSSSTLARQTIRIRPDDPAIPTRAPSARPSPRKSQGRNAGRGRHAVILRLQILLESSRIASTSCLTTQPRVTILHNRPGLSPVERMRKSLTSLSPGGTQPRNGERD